MTAHVLCIDNSTSRSAGRQKNLEDAGFVVVNACDQTLAVGLLKSRRIDVVCVGSRLLNTGGSRLRANIKNLRPHVSLILICGNGIIPAAFQEDVDVVIDESDFTKKAQWLIGELQDVDFPFFVKWFEDWKRRVSASKNDQQSTFAEMSSDEAPLS